MNPIVQYIDRKLPFGPLLPLVRKRLSETSTRNYKDKQEFLDYIESIKPSRRVDTYLVLNCRCGKIYEYKNKDEVPFLTLMCGCGRELIVYGD